MNPKKIHYTWKDMEHMIQVINNLMYQDNWRPDYIVGLTRGGLVPATIMSNMTGIPMYALDVRFRDTGGNYTGPESSGWMAQDAMGEGPNGVTGDHYKKNILIIDDINDEFGDILFSLINYARHNNIDPEQSLNSSTEKFKKRFNTLEKIVESNGVEIKNISEKKLNDFWEKSKKINS